MSGDATLSAGAITLASAQTNVATVTNNGLVLQGNGNIKLDMQNSGVAKFMIGSDDKVLFNTSGVTIAGNLTVQGTTTTIDSTTINVSRSFTFEGPASDFETVFGYGAADAPIADTTITLPTLGAGTYHLPVLANAPTAASALVTAAEFAVLDGDDSATSVTIADSDQMILNDNGTMIQIAMSDVKTYAGGAAAVLPVVAKVNGNDLEADKLNLVANLTANATLTLPESNNNLIGKSLYLKASAFSNGAVIIVNTEAGDQKVDGVNSITLESPYAAVRLVYVAEDDWRVF
jgi:hypothetical protein